MTLKKLPPSVRRLFEIYSRLSSRQNSIIAKDVGGGMTSCNDLSHINGQWQLLQYNRTKGKGRYDSDRNLHMFKNPIYFGPYALKSTNALFNSSDDTNNPSPLPYTNDFKNELGKFIGNVEKALLSYYSPHQKCPATHNLKQALVYYTEIFAATHPIILLFKSTNTLFSPFAMNHYDLKYMEFRRNVIKMNVKLGFQYRLSTIQNIDLFKLGLKYSNFVNTTNYDPEKKDIASAPWLEINKITDSLANRINTSQDVQIFNTHLRMQVPVDDRNLEKYLSTKKSLELLDEDQIVPYCSAMPYDINFTNYYMLNVTELGPDRHNEIVKLLESTDLEVVGAIFNLNNKVLNEMINDIVRLRNMQSSTGYDDLLELTHIPDKNDVALLMEYLATKGFVSLRESYDRQSLYLLK